MHASELTRFALDNPQACDELLQEISEIAQDYESYEYGLPLHDEGTMARMREVLVRWLYALALCVGH